MNKTLILFVIYCLISLTDAQTVKKIYIANDDHTDYLWTADENTYKDAFLNTLDYYIRLSELTESNAPEFQSRWNCDGTFWLWTYQQNRPADQFDKLIARIKSGHISSPMNQLVLCLGGAPAEAVLRGMYYAGELERKYNFRFSMAVAMENQVLPYGLSSLWAGSGAKFTWKGVCNCVTKVAGLYDREREIYWLAGPDKSKMLMKWNSLFTNNMSYGGYAEARNPAFAIEFADSSSNFKSRYRYNIIGAFGKGWDDLQTLTDEFVQTAIEKTNPERKVIVSNMEDFFLDFENTYKDSINTYAAAYGNEWDIYCASLAEVSSRVKRAVEKLRSAEAISSLVHLKNPLLWNNLKLDRTTAYRNLGLYWEHNWCANGKISRDVREKWQREIEAGITYYVNNLEQKAASALAKLIKKESGNPTFYVFNPLNWKRTDAADILFDNTDTVHVIDVTTGEEVPSQIILKNQKRYLRITATDVPSIGYKVFEIRNGKGLSFPGAAEFSNNIFENDIYRFEVAPRGAIISLIDKQQNNKEYAANVNGFNINDLGLSDGSIQIENSGPVSMTLLCSSAGHLNHTTRITLFKNIPRIEINNQVIQNFGDIKSWKFAFNINSPIVNHEEVGAVIKAKYLSEGGHYSPVNARYDWLTLNHFADMSDAAGNGITLSNADCYFMQLGNSNEHFLDTATPLISVLIGGQVDGVNIGIQNQGGDTYFKQRFALKTHTQYSAAEAMKFSLEHQNPFTTSFISGGDFYPADNFSFINIDDSSLILWSIKPTEDDNNSVVFRLWNLKDESVNTNLEFSKGTIKKVVRTTHIETPVEDAAFFKNSVPVLMEANQFQTFSIEYEIDSVPVELISFSAEKFEKGVMLKWITGTETNNSGFDIQRSSADTRDWKSVGFVNGAGTVTIPTNYSFFDTSVVSGSIYYYRLKLIDLNGSYTFSQELKVDLFSFEYNLFQNYPNPFNPGTKLKFSIANRGRVKITLYDLLGETIQVIVNNVYDAGIHEIEFSNEMLSSGVYFYRIDTANYTSVKKMIILK